MVDVDTICASGGINRVSSLVSENAVIHERKKVRQYHTKMDIDVGNTSVQWVPIGLNAQPNHSTLVNGKSR